MARHYRLSWFQKDRCGYWFHSYKDETGKWKKKYFERGSSKHGDIEAYRESVKQFDAWLQEHNPVNVRERKVSDKRDKVYYKPSQARARKSWRPKTTIEGLFDRFIDDKVDKLIDINTDAGIRQHQSAFARFISPPKDGGFLRGHKSKEHANLHASSGLSDTSIIGFAKWLRKHVREGRLAHSSAQDYLRCMKNFAQFCFERRWIDDYRFPRQAVIGKVKKNHEIFTFELDELCTFWAHCDERMRIILLLGLNAGYTAMDVSDLRLKHIKFDASGMPLRIIKRRTKTDNEQNHILWPKTARMLLRWIKLKKIETGEQVLFMTNQGNPMTHHRMTLKTAPDGSTKRSVYIVDGIGEHFRKIAKPLREEGLLRPQITFKHCRKAGGTRIFEECLKAGVVDSLLIEQIFYSHTFTSMARRHYTNLDRAIADPYLLAAGEYFSKMWLDDEGNER